MATTTQGPQTEPSLGELVVQLTEQSGRLVHDEVAHAKAELREDLKHAGIGAGLAGGAGVLALFGLATLVVAAVAGLALVVEVWLAALIVAGALFLVAGAAALVAKEQVAEAGPPIRTVESVQQDVAALKGHLDE